MRRCIEGLHHWKGRCDQVNAQLHPSKMQACIRDACLLYPHAWHACFSRTSLDVLGVALLHPTSEDEVRSSFCDHTLCVMQGSAPCGKCTQY